MTIWYQKEICLPPYPRGFHLVTDKIVKEIDVLPSIAVGLLHVFILHTSASLTINENADSMVRADFEGWFNRAVRENEPWFRHTQEGSDDMPAHLKSSLLGSSLSIPLAKGRLKLGTWQGIYLCEHRDNGGSRTLALTVNGQKNQVLQIIGEE